MNAVAKIEPKEQTLAVAGESTSLLSVIERAASNPDVDVDKMERLMQMHERILARQAEQAFNDAMNAAQSQIGRVAADKENSQTHSWYPTYAALDREIRPVYSANGFALSFDTEPAAVENMVRVICHVSHSAGHTRTYRVDMPADGKGARGNDVMTKTHAAGSAMSYGMRYLLKLIFNVAVGVDLDDDGNGASNPEMEIDPSWFDAIKSAADEASLRKVKADMVKAWKESSKVPKQLTDAYNSRRHKLVSASHG